MLIGADSETTYYDSNNKIQHSSGSARYESSGGAASEIAEWSQRSNVVQQYIKNVVTSRLSGTAILLYNVDARRFLSQKKLVYVEHHLEAPVVPRWSKTTVKNAFYDAL